jgi:hypothetical protein
MNDIDELMARDPLSLDDTDIDEIIAYHRRNRGLKAQGIKPMKAKGVGSVDLSVMVSQMVAAKPKVATPAISRSIGKRRF